GVTGRALGTGFRRVTATQIPADELVNDLEQIVFLHKGSTFLLLEDGSHVKPGDCLLVGRRLTGKFQNRKPEASADGGPATGGPASGGPGRAPKAARSHPGAAASGGGRQNWVATHKPTPPPEGRAGARGQGDPRGRQA